MLRSSMLHHAARAVPWPLVAAASLLITGLLAAVRYDSWTLWPLQGTAVGLLAGAVGWCLDEPAAAVVDPAPRGLAWRTLARTAGIAPLLAAWCAAVWWARADLYGHPWAVLVQGFAAATVATAWVTRRRAAGEATPGQRWAIVVVPVTTAWALVRPVEEHLPVFPYGYGDAFGDWTISSAGWAVTGLTAALMLAATLIRDGRPWYRPRAGRPSGISGSGHRDQRRDQPVLDRGGG
ncbi:hypothetical protein ABZS66_31670 [Dactylosporangium sp. NPDC005572]|uniref:hypothetical protein n=1 Tax=Dactylosporangium sp. NPDC005572 TaxID=3156889 RepID=UPI0033B0FA5F